MYEAGIGVTKNSRMALIWYQEACETAKIQLLKNHTN